MLLFSLRTSRFLFSHARTFCWGASRALPKFRAAIETKHRRMFAYASQTYLQQTEICKPIFQFFFFSSSRLPDCSDSSFETLDTSKNSPGDFSPRLGFVLRPAQLVAVLV